MGTVADWRWATIQPNTTTRNVASAFQAAFSRETI